LKKSRKKTKKSNVKKLIKHMKVGKKESKEPIWGNCVCHKKEYCIIHPLKFKKIIE